MKIWFIVLSVLSVSVSGALQGGTPDQSTIAVTHLPDFKSIVSVEEKKTQFFNYLRPIVVRQLAVIKKEREQLLALSKRKEILSKSERRWVSSLINKYRVNVRVKGDWGPLLDRVDTVPVELILAQAANESAWGTSRFAVKGNNLFGQWCYKKNCGLVPSKRASSARHEVAVFASPEDSVRAYLLNINRNKSYKDLRYIRATMRKQNAPLVAEALALGLIKYSEKGVSYIRTIQKMIRVNRPLMLAQSVAPS